jgi:hypothetical protein
MPRKPASGTLASPGRRREVAFAGMSGLNKGFSLVRTLRSATILIVAFLRDVHAGPLCQSSRNRATHRTTMDTAATAGV